MKNKILYWFCQIFGWGFYSFIGYASLSFRGQTQNLDRWLMFFISITILLIIATHFFRNYIIKSKLIEKSLSQILIKVSLGIFTIAVVINTISGIFIVTPFNIITWEQFSFKALAFYIVNTSFFLIAWSGIYLTISYIRFTRKREIEKLKLEVVAKESQINSLKAQINPHFIFNSLNNIRSLMFENTEQASDMITHLSDLLRYSMKFNDSGKETIKTEIEIVEDYLKLQSIHLEDRLSYKINVTDDLLNFSVPSMSVQLLVENAIKHGIQELPQGGNIEINIFRDQKNIYVEVLNNGMIKESKTSTKIGLKNASERLKLMFGKNAILELTQKEPNLVSAKFNVPV